MERRFDLRLEELLEDAVLDPRIPEGMLDRLERLVEPFAATEFIRLFVWRRRCW